MTATVRDPVAPAGRDEPAALRNRWTDIVRRDAWIHLPLMVAIVAATFQGYLKDRIGGPLPYALADLSFILAATVWFATLAVRHAPLRAPGRSGHLILVIVAVPTLYLLHPGTPLLIELAGLRAWVAYPVAALIALTAIHNAAQARAYVGLVLVLCVITAIYGILQYMRGPEDALATAFGLDRHGVSVFYDIIGETRTEFRAFSTFTFPAPFASMMVFGMLLAGGIVLSRRYSVPTRWLVAAMIPLFFAGMTVSGTRAALITLLLGFLVLVWFRRLHPGMFLIVPVGFIALHIATLLTAGRFVTRFTTVLLQENVLWNRIFAPVTIAGRALTENPLGMGLGRTGIGVPFQMFRAQPQGFFIGSDGDIGRAAVELGIFGLFLLAVIVVGVIPYGARAMAILRDTTMDDIALGMGALIVSTALIILIGSPLSAAPHGMIWWLFLGILLKLAMMSSASSAPARERPH